MKPFTNKHSIAAGSPIHMGVSGESPLYIDPALEETLKPGKEENLGTTETSERVRGGTKKTFTTKYRTPGDEVHRTTAGDKAYAALSPEGRKKQDSAYLAAKNREEVRTRFIPDSLKTNLKPSSITYSPKISADIKINKAKLQERLDPVKKIKYTSERGTSYGGQAMHGSTGYVDADQAGDLLSRNSYVKLEGVRQSGKTFDVLQKGKSRGLAPGTTVKEDLAKGRKKAAADKSAKAKADILARRAEKKKAKNS
jgi:hypothetical protein